MAQSNKAVAPKRRSKVRSYDKWGYIFLIPFFTVFCIFTLVPLGTTIYNSFFENYMGNGGLKQVGPNWVGLGNFKALFSDNQIWQYTANTGIMWIIGFIPQILVSLLLASWFSDTRLKLKGSGFFKIVIYLPNLIMASAFAMLFVALFSRQGPLTKMLLSMGVVDNKWNIFDFAIGSRGLVGLMNFLMWFGNTTILLMAGIMGIDVSLYEAAEVDGANSKQRFWKITVPLLKPIFVYVLITSLIGGLQMYDVPQILSDGRGGPLIGGKRTTQTLIMYLNQYMKNKNVGMAGALSVVLFILTAILSVVVYRIMYSKKAREA